MGKLDEFKLIDEDFGPYSPADIRCRLCSGICGLKTVRVYNDSQILICTKEGASREVLANEKSRRS